MALALTACNGMAPTAGEPEPTLLEDGVWSVTLHVGETARVRGVTVQFVRVLEDSRCASDVVCVWAGNGEVELAVWQSLGNVERVRLNSTVEPRSLVRHGVEIRLSDLRPHPVSTASIDPDAYVLELEVDEGAS